MKGWEALPQTTGLLLQDKAVHDLDLHLDPSPTPRRQCGCLKKISPICIYLGRGVFSVRMSDLVRMGDMLILFVLLLSEGSLSLGLGDSRGGGRAQGEQSVQIAPSSLSWSFLSFDSFY